MIDIRDLMRIRWCVPLIALVGFACMMANIWFDVGWLFWVGVGFYILAVTIALIREYIPMHHDEKDEDVYL